MPKYRKLHVKAVESLDVNDMPDDFTRLFWILLPLALDREGRGLDNTAWLKSKVFPLRLDVTAEMIAEAMGWWEQRRMIERYKTEGRSYFWVPQPVASWPGREHRSAWANASWREAVFQRDDYTCQMCGKRGGRLNAHHIKAWSLHPEDRLNIKNGVTLCQDCHRAKHGRGWKRASR